MDKNSSRGFTEDSYDYDGFSNSYESTDSLTGSGAPEAAASGSVTHTDTRLDARVSTNLVKFYPSVLAPLFGASSSRVTHRVLLALQASSRIANRSLTPDETGVISMCAGRTVVYPAYARLFGFVSALLPFKPPAVMSAFTFNTFTPRHTLARLPLAFIVSYTSGVLTSILVRSYNAVVIWSDPTMLSFRNSVLEHGPSLNGLQNSTSLPKSANTLPIETQENSFPSAPDCLPTISPEAKSSCADDFSLDFFTYPPASSVPSKSTSSRGQAKSQTGIGIDSQSDGSLSSRQPTMSAWDRLRQQAIEENDGNRRSS